MISPLPTWLYSTDQRLPNATPSIKYGLVRQQQAREARRNVKTGPFEMLGGKGRLFLLFGRRRGRRPRNGGLKVRISEKHLRAELRQELGLSLTRTHDPTPHTQRSLKIDYFNQRRVLAEKQKPLLAQAAAQTAEARRS